MGLSNGAVIGASVGAGIGSLFPVIGTLIGAGIGGVVGDMLGGSDSANGNGGNNNNSNYNDDDSNTDVNEDASDDAQEHGIVLDNEGIYVLDTETKLKWSDVTFYDTTKSEAEIPGLFICGLSGGGDFFINIECARRTEELDSNCTKGSDDIDVFVNQFKDAEKISSKKKILGALIAKSKHSIRFFKRLQMVSQDAESPYMLTLSGIFVWLSVILIIAKDIGQENLTPKLQEGIAYLIENSKYFELDEDDKQKVVKELAELGFDVNMPRNGSDSGKGSEPAELKEGNTEELSDSSEMPPSETETVSQKAGFSREDILFLKRAKRYFVDDGKIDASEHSDLDILAGKIGLDALREEELIEQAAEELGEK